MGPFGTSFSVHHTFNRYFKNVKNRKISGIGSDDELYDSAVKEYKEGEEKSFPFCDCAKHLRKIPHFDPMIDPMSLVLADKSVLSKGMRAIWHLLWELV